MENIETEITAPRISSEQRRISNSRRSRVIQAVLLPVISLILLLVVWQFLVVELEVPDYIMPPPTDFLERLVEDRELLADHLSRTAYEVAAGFSVAVVFSIPLGFLISTVTFFERTLYPIIVFIQLTPKIAVAPLFIVWFGFGVFPKVLITFLLCFFPILVASMSGFRSIDERILYLSRSMGASPLQSFRYIRIPSALPYIFSGLRVAIVFASTGAIVGEFVGAQKGLGYLLLRGTSYLDTPLIFAVLVVLAVMGLTFSYIVVVVEYFVMPWKRKEKN